jgi:hypothetical protein
MSVEYILFLMVLFQVKHLLADFILQSGWMVRTKGIYGHWGGICHSGLHALLSAIVLLFTPLDPAMLAMIVFGEFIVHYHLDWFKDRETKKYGYTATHKGFWTLAGLDQFAHHLTYIAILMIVLRVT